MSAALPLFYRWDGESFTPVGTRGKLEADRQFVIGQTYRLAEEQERSMLSHRHEFAWLREAWMNLPENIADQYPSPEHLRKRALIEAKFYTEQIIDAGSNAAALRVASGIKSREEFSVVIVRESIVVIRDPKSQSVRAMGPKEFQASKTAIMEIIAALIGVTPEELQKQAGKAA